MVPVENSTDGAVGRTLDLLLATPAHICGEVLLPVHQCLMSKAATAEPIQKIYAHAQSLAQCHEWLNQNLPRSVARAGGQQRGGRAAGRGGAERGIHRLAGRGCAV